MSEPAAEPNQPIDDLLARLKELAATDRLDREAWCTARVALECAGKPISNVGPRSATTAVRL